MNYLSALLLVRIDCNSELVCIHNITSFFFRGFSFHRKKKLFAGDMCGDCSNAMVASHRFAHIPLSAHSPSSSCSICCWSNHLSYSISEIMRLCFFFSFGGRIVFTIQHTYTRNLPYAFLHVLLTNHRTSRSLLKGKKKKARVVGLFGRVAYLLPSCSCECLAGAYAPTKCPAMLCPDTNHVNPLQIHSKLITPFNFIYLCLITGVISTFYD